MSYDIEVRKTRKKGLGVYALRDFKKGEVIEKAPTLLLDTKDRAHCEETPLSHYMYPWRSTRSGAIAFGYGSIYNHSFEPNADWKQNFKEQVMVYTAIKDIKKDEEILVNYNGEPDDTTPIDWFDVEN